MENKIVVYHFHNGCGGGVLTVIKNLLKFSDNCFIENHIIHVVNKTLLPNFVIEPIIGVTTQQLFYYTSENNFYYTCKQLSKLLPNEKVVIVAHDWIELGMASNLGLQNPVIQILHGNYDYYYNLSIDNNNAIDVFICISQKIFNTLKAKLPSRNEDILFLRFPVPELALISKNNDVLQIIYYVTNLKDDNKQFTTIIEIATQLSKTPEKYFFTIAGGVMTPEEFLEIWPVNMKHRVNFLGYQTNDAILKILPTQDIFLLPSKKEGLPISLIEAMKAGVVPLITAWDGGVEELVSDNLTGFNFNIGDSKKYIECIIFLQANARVLKMLSNNCIKKATEQFKPFENTRNIENSIRQYSNIGNKKRPSKVYGSRLDHPLIPNKITSLIRKIL